MEELDFKSLLKDESFINYCRGTDQADIDKWERWLRDNPQYKHEIEEYRRIIETAAVHTAQVAVERNYLRLQERIQDGKTPVSINQPTRHKLSWIKVAAAIILLASAVGSVYTIKQSSVETDRKLVQEEEIQPGCDDAYLTLSDGTVVSLSEAENGTVAMQDGFRIEKSADGLVSYRFSSEKSQNTTAYNTISTPAGGQYSVELPDGSTVFLNAKSSVSFPLRFAENERRVKMTGEVYFEVAKAMHAQKHTRLPFLVETGKQEVQVLGTKFNINAYDDEEFVRTTLLEGSVRIVASKDGHSVLLKPGQQAVLSDRLVVNSVIPQEEMAWKEGDFVFQGATLAQILRQVSRWYNVEVECPPHLETLRFNGMVSRTKPLSSIMNIVKSTDKVKIILKGRRIIVTD